MGTESSSLKGPVKTPAQLLKRLEQHDWYYTMADDHESWRKGQDDRDEIRAGAKLVPNGEAIMKHYVACRNLVNYGHE